MIRQAHPNAAGYPLPPGPTSYHPLGYMNAMNVDPLRFFLQLAQQHGGITQFRAGFWPVYLVAGPTAIRHLLRDNPANYSKDTFTYRMVRSVTGNGLLTSDGEEWHQRRRLLQPIFARDRIAHYDTQIMACTRAMIERWQQHVAEGQPIDVGTEITRLTLNIACKTFFDVDLAEQTTGPVREAVLTLSTAFTTRFRLKTAPLWGMLGFPTPDNPQLSQARSTLTAVVDQVIQRLENVDTPAGHVLAQLTLTKDPDTGRQLSRQELQTEVLTFWCWTAAMYWSALCHARTATWIGPGDPTVRGTLGDIRSHLPRGIDHIDAEPAHLSSFDPTPVKTGQFRKRIGYVFCPDRSVND